MTARRIGILGGTFDPIHWGHIDLGRVAQAALDLKPLFVVTSNIPPHRPQPFASPCQRFAMTAMAVASLEGWQASDLELRAGEQSFTTDTLARFHDEGYRSPELFFLVGADAFLEIETWKDYPAILEQAHFAVVSRPGFPVVTLSGRLPKLVSRMRHPPFDTTEDGTLIFLIDAPTTDTSSTAIRRRRAEGKSIAGLVPPCIQQHVERHGLYASPTGSSRAPEASHEPAAGRLHGQN